MRRRLGVAAAMVVAIVLATVAPAAAQSTFGQLKAPQRTPGEMPVWVRSVTPCRLFPGEYQFVRVGFQPSSDVAGDPPGVDYMSSVDGWLNPDGSWEVTLVAPSIPSGGPTMPYEIHAQCLMHTDPYYVAPRDEEGAGDGEDEEADEEDEDAEDAEDEDAEDEDQDAGEEEDTVTAEDLLVSTQRYQIRSIWVTSNPAATTAAPGAGGTDGTSGGSDEDDDTEGSDADAEDNDANGTSSAAGVDDTSSSSFKAADAHDDEGAVPMKRDTSDVRAEIAAAGGDRPMIIQATPAAAAWAQPRPTRDPGIPGWAFLCAAMLAVGAVIAWGNRRSSDLGE